MQKGDEVTWIAQPYTTATVTAVSKDIEGDPLYEISFNDQNDFRIIWAYEHELTLE